MQDEKSGYKEAFSLTEGLPLDHSPLPGREEEEGGPLDFDPSLLFISTPICPLYLPALSSISFTSLSPSPPFLFFSDLPLVRHGCTSDVRDLLWATTRQHVPSDEKELRARLQEAALGVRRKGGVGGKEEKEGKGEGWACAVLPCLLKAVENGEARSSRP